MQHDGGWKRKSFRHLYQSRWFSVRQDELVLPAGADVTYTVIEHPGYAMVVPLLDDGRVVMVRVFRHALQRTLLECPSGGLDGEDPEIAARRELEEEAGFRAERLVPLGVFYGSSGISNERCHLFVATGLHDLGETRHEATEQIVVERVPLADLRAAVLRGEVPDGPSSLALLLASEHAKRDLRP